MHLLIIFKNIEDRLPFRACFLATDAFDANTSLRQNLLLGHIMMWRYVFFPRVIVEVDINLINLPLVNVASIASSLCSFNLAYSTRICFNFNLMVSCECWNDNKHSKDTHLPSLRLFTVLLFITLHHDSD
jgi:hypothetical protein